MTDVTIGQRVGDTYAGISDGVMWEAAVDWPGETRNPQILNSTPDSIEKPYWFITIPDLGEKVITNARLMLRSEGFGGSQLVRLNRILRPGVYGELCYARYSDGNDWAGPAATGVGDAELMADQTHDFDVDVYYPFGAGSALNAVVQALADGGGTLILAMEPISNYVFFNPSEADDVDKPYFAFTHEPVAAPAADFAGVLARIVRNIGG